VRMYLRGMRSIGLLSCQGEVAIAKRIEAGREAMIAGLCESPLTFRRRRRRPHHHAASSTPRAMG
jgi:RNA polymerase primary sigma factor